MRVGRCRCRLDDSDIVPHHVTNPDTALGTVTEPEDFTHRAPIYYINFVLISI